MRIYLFVLFFLVMSEQTLAGEVTFVDLAFTPLEQKVIQEKVAKQAPHADLQLKLRHDGDMKAVDYLIVLDGNSHTGTGEDFDKFDAAQLAVKWALKAIE